jgi:hypothetical protein
MVTKDQAMRAGSTWGGADFHYGECTRTVGPRGGVTVRTETWRVNGKCKVWKTRPAEFSLPVKFGLRDFGYITDRNAAEFHLASECPLQTGGADA